MNQSTIVATLDRIESDSSGNRIGVLVLDSGEQLSLPVDRLPEGSREGTVLSITFQVDPEETNRRRDRVRELQSRLFRGPQTPDERT